MITSSVAVLVSSANAMEAKPTVVAQSAARAKLVNFIVDLQA